VSVYPDVGDIVAALEKDSNPKRAIISRYVDLGMLLF